MLDLKALLAKILQYLHASSVVGEIKTYAGVTVPNGWLVCDGSAISRTDYPLLFDAIGTLWGAGDGSTTFNLPNLKGKVPVGYDSSQTEFDTVGETGGNSTHNHTTANHTLTESQIPSHNHPIASNGVGMWIPNAGTSSRSRVASSSSGSIYCTSMSAASGYTWQTTTAARGSGGAHNHGNTGNASNLQPYVVVKYIICAI